MKRTLIFLSASALTLAGCSASEPSQLAQPQGAATETTDADPAPVDCHAGVSLQLLGSGGPISDDGRASSGAVIWIDGKARLLIDAGGGTLLRFGQSGAKLEDRDFIGISHFHTDHVTDLPAILKGAYLTANTHDLKRVGPTGDAHFPSMTAFFNREFGKSGAAFGYLSGLANASDGLKLAVHPANIDVKAPHGTVVWKDGHLVQTTRCQDEGILRTQRNSL